MVKVGFLGLGRMGQAAFRSVSDMSDAEIVCAFDVRNLSEDAGIISGVGVAGVMVSDIRDLEKVLDETKPDIMVDFTSPEACMKNMKAVSKRNIKAVVGTTGLTTAQQKKLNSMLKKAGAIISPNISVGVNVFWKLVGIAARELPGYDIEVVEAHHRFKKDAPSGTAKKAIDVIRQNRKKVNEVYGRKGICPRAEGDVGVHAIRAGDIVGEHSVMYSTLGERFEIKHIAHARDSFATGLPQAIRYIRNKRGVHDMWDVLGLR